MLAAVAGDLRPAERWIRALGATTTWHEDGSELQWNDAPGVPTGGLTVGLDPIGACVELLLASFGIWWVMIPPAVDVMHDVKARWKAQLREKKGKAS
jgi:hypothetical protein